MGPDGRILRQGSLGKVLEQDTHLVKDVTEEREAIEKAEKSASVEKPEDSAAKQAAGKLVVDEEMEVGHVGWTARTSLSEIPSFGTHLNPLVVKLWIGNTSNRPALFWIVYIAGQSSHHILINVQVSAALVYIIHAHFKSCVLGMVSRPLGIPIRDSPG